MKSLADIGRKFGTDKGDAAHAFAGVSFLDVYQEHFAPIRSTVRSMLEIGVAEGASLRMWEEYFPFAQIHGLDIDPCVAFRTARIRVTTGDQHDETVLRRIAGGETFDIVIDDGSHVVDHMVRSLALLWPRVRQGGFYCIEDLHCTHQDISASVDLWPGQSHNAPDTNYRNSRAVFLEAMERYLSHMDAQQWDCAAVHFYPRQVILRKAITA